MYVVTDYETAHDDQLSSGYGRYVCVCVCVCVRVRMYYFMFIEVQPATMLTINAIRRKHFLLSEVDC